MFQNGVGLKVFDEYSSFDVNAREVFLNFSVEDWIAESCFTSIFMWNKVLNTKYTIINGILCCFFSFHEEEYFCSIFCKEKNTDNITETIKELKEIFNSKNLTLKIEYVSESMKTVLENIMNFDFTLKYERKYSDYIFKADCLMDLEGPLNREKRYEYNYFIRHNDYSVVEVTKENVFEALNFMDYINCEKKSCCECDYGCEKDALFLVAENFDVLNCCGIFVMIDGKIAAYVIGERLSERMFAYHFLKQDKRYKGLSVFLQVEFGKRYYNGALYINYSEDLAYLGLRKYKMKLRPFKLAHKYEFEFSNLTHEI